MTPSPQPPEATVPAQPAEIPEHTVVLLLEGAQRFLAKAEEAIGSQDSIQLGLFLRKIKAILKELHRRLNHEQGGELVDNLVRLYGWWEQEITAAMEQRDAARLRAVRAQMGDIRQAWEHVLFQGEGMSETPGL